MKAIGLFTALLLAVGCAQAPDLPPEDTLIVPDFFDESDTLVQADTTDNIQLARAAVGFVTTGVALATLLPRAVLAAALQSSPVQEGDEWVWTRNFPLFATEASFYASDVAASGIAMRMEITNQDVTDFVAYSGTHTFTQGFWEFFETEAPGVPVLRIDWTRNAADDKSLVFRNVKPDVDENGDEIDYTLSGTTATMSLVNAVNGDRQREELSVQWDTETGAGRMTRTGEEDLCWDTLTNGQEDIVCP